MKHQDLGCHWVHICVRSKSQNKIKTKKRKEKKRKEKKTETWGSIVRVNRKHAENQINILSKDIIVHRKTKKFNIRIVKYQSLCCHADIKNKPAPDFYSFNMLGGLMLLICV